LPSATAARWLRSKRDLGIIFVVKFILGLRDLEAFRDVQHVLWSL
jgi:hypothetical protein